MSRETNESRDNVSDKGFSCWGSLVIANPKGHFTQLLSKVGAIQNKYGTFGALFILGDLFAGADQSEELEREEQDFLSGALQGRFSALLFGLWFGPSLFLPLSLYRFQSIFFFLLLIHAWMVSRGN